ncbi:gamma-mobile-trio recombinase GmtY [Roseateles sp. DC23W]|uniref:Gamma-mobile-trio recombinase GmtY n=1 Tax=Pelomonas dachongensis TaxID=3299029 RepID=A0ABW7EG87_9BURK
MHFAAVKSKVRLDATGRTIAIPALLTPAGLLTPLLDYCVHKHHIRSLSWAQKVVHAVELFLDYMHANPAQTNSHLLFRNFAGALYSGTFDPATCTDPSGLCWLPREGKDAGDIISALSLFFDWQGENMPLAAEINPLVDASYYDQLWNETARRYRRDKAFLGHLWGPADNETGKTRSVGRRRGLQVRHAEPPAFPEDRFDELITDGFRVGNRIDHRGIAITLLMHGAGFRVSEPFHLFVEDIIPFGGSALVRIHHPSEGYAPDSWVGPTGRPRTGKRAAYLMENFGLLPRTEYNDRQHAGWKGGLLDAKFYMQAHWLGTGYAERFSEHWMEYLHQLGRIPRPHPFAFANLSRGPTGDMYCIETFTEAHARACKRIGLTVDKALGTTAHGHRHAYGRRLKAGGASSEFIKIFMHHVSEDSQKVYTGASSAEVAQELQKAQARLAESVAKKQALLLTDTQ